jgi:hypothetical protein
MTMGDATLGPVELIRLAFGLAALGVVPGFLWHAAFWPPGADLRPAERLATIPLVSYLVSACVALALARVGLLGTASMAIALALVSAVGGVASVVRLRRLGRWSWSWLPAWPVLIAGALGFGLVAVVIVLPQLGLIFPDAIPVGSITWYYWGLAQQILDTGSIPRLSAEWGGQYPYQGDYVMFSAFSSALGFLGGRTSEFALMEALRLGSLAWGLIAAIGALRRFLPIGGALVCTVMFFSSIFVVGKYTGYRPESFHYALIFSALWAVDRFAERSTAIRAVPIVAVIVALWIGHGVVLVVAGLLGAAVFVARWLVDGRVSRRQLLAAGTVLGAGFLSAIVVDFVLQGTVILLANAADPGPIQGPTTSDITWQFFQWALGGEPLLSGDPSEAATVFSRIIEAPWLFVDAVGTWPAYLIAVIPLATWRFLATPARRLYLGSLIYLVGLGLAVLAFLTLYETYVPQRVGFGRLAPFALVGASLIVAVAATGIVGAIRRAASATTLRRTGLADGRRASLLVGAAAWTAVIALAVVAVRPSITRGTAAVDAARLSSDGVAAMRWVRDNTPSDAIVYANAYTEGVIEVIAGRNGLLDGRAPYNKEFDFLLRAVEQLRVGRSFMAGEASVDRLVELGVDVVVVSPNAYDLANPTRFCQPAAEIDRSRPCFEVAIDGRPGLRRAATFGDIEIYLVEASSQ